MVGKPHVKWYYTWGFCRSRYNLHEEARRFTTLLAGSNVADDYARKYRFREGVLERGNLDSSIEATARTNPPPDRRRLSRSFVSVVYVRSRLRSIPSFSRNEYLVRVIGCYIRHEMVMCSCQVSWENFFSPTHFRLKTSYHGFTTNYPFSEVLEARNFETVFTAISHDDLRRQTIAIKHHSQSCTFRQSYTMRTETSHLNLRERSEVYPTHMSEMSVSLRLLISQKMIILSKQRNVTDTAWHISIKLKDDKKHWLITSIFPLILI